MAKKKLKSEQNPKQLLKDNEHIKQLAHLLYSIYMSGGRPTKYTKWYACNTGCYGLDINIVCRWDDQVKTGAVGEIFAAETDGE